MIVVFIFDGNVIAAIGRERQLVSEAVKCTASPCTVAILPSMWDGVIDERRPVQVLLSDREPAGSRAIMNNNRACLSPAIPRRDWDR